MFQKGPPGIWQGHVGTQLEESSSDLRKLEHEDLQAFRFSGPEFGFLSPKPYKLSTLNPKPYKP